MTRPYPFLTEPQWHQGHSPRLCPLWLPGQFRRSFSPPGSPSPCPEHDILALGSYAASALLPTRWHFHVLWRGNVGEDFPGSRTSVSRIPVAACYRPGAVGTTYRHGRPCRYPAPSHVGSGVSATFTCSLSRSVIAGSLRQPRSLSENEHKWHVGLASACRSCLQMARLTHRNATEPLDSKKLLLRRSDTLPRAIAAS